MAEVLSEYAGTADLREKAFDIAGYYKICVLVYEAGNIAAGSEAVSVECSPLCLIHHLPEDALKDYAQRAAENGGSLLETLGMDSSGIPGGRARSLTEQPMPSG